MIKLLKNYGEEIGSRSFPKKYPCFSGSVFSTLKGKISELPKVPSLSDFIRFSDSFVRFFFQLETFFAGSLFGIFGSNF